MIEGLLCIISFVSVAIIVYMIWSPKLKKAAEQVEKDLMQAENDIQRRKEELLITLNRLHEDYLATAGEIGRLELFAADIQRAITVFGYWDQELCSIFVDLDYSPKYLVEELLKEIQIKLTKDIVIGEDGWKEIPKQD